MSGDHNMYCSANNPKGEWTELPTLVSVCNAQTDGWEIQVYDDYDSEWIDWAGNTWATFGKYRGRPRQPKMKKLKMLCYTDGECLYWNAEHLHFPSSWIRIPAQDIEIEVPA